MLTLLLQILCRGNCFQMHGRVHECEQVKGCDQSGIDFFFMLEQVDCERQIHDLCCGERVDA